MTKTNLVYTIKNTPTLKIKFRYHNGNFKSHYPGTDADDYIRAIAIALNKSYAVVFKDFFTQVVDRIGMNKSLFKRNLHNYLYKQGWKWYSMKKFNCTEHNVKVKNCSTALNCKYMYNFIPRQMKLVQIDHILLPIKDDSYYHIFKIKNIGEHTVYGYWIYVGKSEPCYCGCGQIPSEGKKYITGHNLPFCDNQKSIETRRKNGVFKSMSEYPLMCRPGAVQNMWHTRIHGKRKKRKKKVEQKIKPVPFKIITKPLDYKKGVKGPETVENQILEYIKKHKIYLTPVDTMIIDCVRFNKDWCNIKDIFKKLNKIKHIHSMIFNKRVKYLIELNLLLYKRSEQKELVQLVN